MVSCFRIRDSAQGMEKEKEMVYEVAQDRSPSP